MADQARNDKPVAGNQSGEKAYRALATGASSYYLKSKLTPQGLRHINAVIRIGGQLELLLARRQHPGPVA